MNSFGQGRHCVETWATICDQNNPIINLDTESHCDDAFYNDKLINAATAAQVNDIKLNENASNKNNLQR